jgi:multiphosphoryl transfer protein
MVGIVIVSHSATLARGVVELAREMGGPEVTVEAAGGTSMPEAPLGTDAALVVDAIARARSGDGVLVLMDLGSAVLSAEMALDLLSDEERKGILLCAAPLVEGAVAAATAARIGRSLQEVAVEAAGGLAPKTAHLGDQPAVEGSLLPGAADAAGDAESIEVGVTNPLGLHARPAARFVKTAAEFDATISVENLTTGAGPASGQSLNAVATLGVRMGHRIRVSAKGPGAEEALAAIAALAEANFGDAPEEERTPSAADRVVPDGAIVGLPAAPGIAIGPAYEFVRDTPTPSSRAPESPEEEWRALESAMNQARETIRVTRRSVAERVGEANAEIFDAHLLMLEDDELIEPARRGIFEEGKNASRAWDDAIKENVMAFRQLDNEYLAARSEDVEAIGADVLRLLEGASAVSLHIDEPGVVVARELAPADTAGLDPEFVQGFVTATGGPTSHSAILARALGVPAVVGAGEAVMTIRHGERLILDGDHGIVLVDPDDDVQADYRSRIAERNLELDRARAAARDSAVTTDGTVIEVAANIGAPEDVARALESGADAIGLLRTEFLYLDRTAAPSEEEQFTTLRAIAEDMDGKPVIIRTLDAGADKPLPFLQQASEDNPFLGMRGIRLSLANRELVRAQLRAIARVATEFPVKVMFPMVTNIDEFLEARELLETETRAGAGGRVATGIMVEVPAAALSAAVFAPAVDFFSIGTNDLTQYTVAADRGNAGVAGLADGLHPAVLRLIAEVTEHAARHDKWVGVCGELAGDPTATPILVGLGVNELSMSAPSIPLVKAAIRDLNLSSARELARHALDLGSAEEVRVLLARGESRGSTPQS